MTNMLEKQTKGLDSEVFLKNILFKFKEIQNLTEKKVFKALQKNIENLKNISVNTVESAKETVSAEVKKHFLDPALFVIQNKTQDFIEKEVTPKFEAVHKIASNFVKKQKNQTEELLKDLVLVSL